MTSPASCAEEIADLAARGCTYLQMDEVPLAVICDRNNMEVVRKRGDNPEQLIDLYLDAINNSIGERPPNMTVCVHLCRGNYAQGMADGGYEPIAERMFDQLDVDGYFLEYDTPRAAIRRFATCPSRGRRCSASYPRSYRSSKARTP